MKPVMDLVGYAGFKDEQGKKVYLFQCVDCKRVAYQTEEDTWECNCREKK